MDAYLDAMRNYATFTGRSTRSQYWLCGLVVLVMLIVAVGLDKAWGTGFAPGEGGLFLLTVYVVHFMPLLAVSIRRLHDIDRTGWWVLLGPVPLAGLVLLVFACIPSTVGSNRFGPPSTPTAAETPPAAAPTPAAASATAAPNTIDQLERLASLKASGAIDDSEYQKLKTSILG